MNQKKTIIVLIFILLVGIVGLTVAYFSNTTSINNLFSTNPYGTTVEEVFVSPDNWLPGTTTDKEITVTNSGSVDEAVRISYSETWKTKDNTILSGLIDQDGYLTSNTENSEHAAIINFSDNDDWTYSNGYYYYNFRLAPNETTSSLIDSVTFNSKTKNSSNCITNTNNGVKTITCNSTQSGYDGATYTLKFTIETVQYNKYKEAWGVDVATSSMKPMTAQQFISKANPVSITNYTDGNVHEMYTFEHDATVQTPALTDYRYIGDDPYNYVYFNCDSLDNQNEDTCEVWRIIGVFDVEDEDGNWETRFKLVRGSAFTDIMRYDESLNSNDWTNVTLNEYLNKNYFYQQNISNGLKVSSRYLIDNAEYYLGGKEKNISQPYYGSTEEIYAWERGNVVYGNKSINWIGKIGLMYPSDMYMTYAKEVNTICFNNPNECQKPNLGWIHNSSIRDGQYFPSSMWFISPVILENTNYFVFMGPYNLSTANGSCDVRPVLYLKSNVKLIDGNGSESNPYKLGYTDEYTIYTKGQTVTYDNKEYYVMSTSGGNKSYVKLLKKEPLTANEINSYNTNYTSTNGEFPYLENNNCNNSNTTNCNTNYDTSNIKIIIDTWSSNYNNDLISINGYKARLVNENDIMNYFDFYSSHGFKVTSDSTPSWVIINGKSYWSMEVSEDSNTQVYGVSNTLSSEDVYNKLYIRPVINLKKCAINGTC